jgi:hypothetical protein
MRDSFCLTRERYPHGEHDYGAVESNDHPLLNIESALYDRKRTTAL